MKKIILISILILALPLSSSGQGIADVLKLHSSGVLLPGDADMQPLYNLDYLDLGIGSVVVPGPGPSSTIFSKITGIDSHWMVLQTTNDTNDHIVLLPSGNVGINTTTHPPWAKLDVLSTVLTTRKNPIFLLEWVGEPTDIPEPIPLLDDIGPALGAEPEPQPEPLGIPTWPYLMIHFQNGLSNFDSYLDYTFGIRGSERVRITYDGNVGIGTTTPGAKLHVSTSAAGIGLVVEHNGDGQIAIQGISHDTVGPKSGIGVLGISDNMGVEGIGNAGNAIGVKGVSSTSGGQAINGEASGGAYAGIFTGGNIGIGTTAPRSILEAGSGAASFNTFPTPGSALSWGTQGIGLNLVRKSTGTWEAAGDGAHNAGVAIFGAIGPEGLRFVTVESTGSSNQTFTDSQIMGKVRMVILSAGNVGIGTVSPSEKMDVDGTARLRGIAAGSGTNVVADGSGKLWKQSSSRRYKTNIQNLEDDTDKVLELRPVRFQWKTTGQEEIGLIAEEVEGIAKDLVVYDQEGKPDAVKYDKVALYLLSVVKTQQHKIEALEAAKAENKSLERRIEALEKIIRQQKFTVNAIQQ